MNRHQQTALDRHCRLAIETMHPDFDRVLPQLAGVGDPTLGEWVEWTGKAIHIRRRLSVVEQRRSGLEVVDIRRTPEALRRAARLGDLIRFAPPEVLADELG